MMQILSIIPSGFGAADARFCVYIANRPPMAEYRALNTVAALQRGEIELINRACGNGWRKVFNVYAKLLFALDNTQFNFQQQASSWQAYRDTQLLQAGSNTALLFSPPRLQAQADAVHIIAGRTHANALIAAGMPAQFHWLTQEFAIDRDNRILVCPYFDYRQLNNEKIIFLSRLISELNHASV
jgi:hypothetical protein